MSPSCKKRPRRFFRAALLLRCSCPGPSSSWKQNGVPTSMPQIVVVVLARGFLHVFTPSAHPQQNRVFDNPHPCECPGSHGLFLASILIQYWRLCSHLLCLLGPMLNTQHSSSSSSSQVGAVLSSKGRVKSWLCDFGIHSRLTRNQYS